MKLAVIDLGTNSVRFDIHEIFSPTERKLIYREKQMVRLGDGAFRNRRLGHAPVLRTLRAFKRFSRVIQRFQVDRVMAFATSAMRDSSNAKSVIDQIKKLTAIEIKIISGKKEAEYTAKAIMKNEKKSFGTRCLIDIGGGSTEITICLKNSVIKSFSLPLGASRLQQLFLSPHGHRSANSVMLLRQYIQSVLKRNFAIAKIPKIAQFMGSSGTIRSLRKILKKRGKKIEPFSQTDLNDLVETMIPLSRSELLRIPGMIEKRVDIILAGSILLQEIMKHFAAEEMYTTPYALRDGILESELERTAI